VRPLSCPRHQSLYSRFTTLIISPFSKASSLDSVGSNACSARTRVTPYTSTEGVADVGSEEGSDGGDDSTAAGAAWACASVDGTYPLEYGGWRSWVVEVDEARAAAGGRAVVAWEPDPPAPLDDASEYSPQFLRPPLSCIESSSTRCNSSSSRLRTSSSSLGGGSSTFSYL